MAEAHQVRIGDLVLANLNHVTELNLLSGSDGLPVHTRPFG